MIKPIRIQLRRIRGWRLQEVSRAINGLPAIACTRPGPHGNPFDIGGWHKIGSGCGGGMIRLRARDASYADSTFTLIKDAQMAVDMHREYLALYPKRDLHLLRGHNLACACALSAPCHVDTLLELANSD